MSNPTDGQTHGRGERIREFTTWTGAKLVDPAGRTISTDPAEIRALNVKVANDELEVIRYALTQKVATIECNTGQRDIADMIRAQLTPSELKRVRFVFFDVPIPRALED